MKTLYIITLIHVLINVELAFTFQIPNIHTKNTRSNSNNNARNNSSILKSATEASADSNATGKSNHDIISTQEELDEYAKQVGVKITFSTLGPGYRAVARAEHDEEQILGYCEGFIRPGGKILHVDKCEVWKKALTKAKQTNPTGFKSGGQIFGVSLLLGYTCMLHGKENNCQIAEFLAIDDEEYQHKRLVRFFTRVGFKKIRYVGEDLKDVPDRLVWGGCGTLMNREIDDLLERWSKVLIV